MKLSKSDQTATYVVEFMSAHGKQLVDTGATTLKEAEHRVKLAKIEELERAAAVSNLSSKALQLAVAGEKVTLEVAAKRYVAWMEKTKAPRTASNSRLMVDAMIRSHCKKDWIPDQVTPEIVSEYINRPHLKLYTRKILRAIIIGFFEFCTSNGWGIKNPANAAVIDYRSIPIEQKERTPKKIFTEGEVEYLIGRIEGFWRHATILSYDLGIRLSDICNLEWKSFTTQPGKVIIWMEKTNERIALDVTDRVRRLIASLPRLDDRFIFPEQREVWERAGSTLSHQFKRICSALGFPGTSFHCLRASYATHQYVRMANADADAADKVAETLGHKSSATTLRHYIDKAETTSTKPTKERPQYSTPINGTTGRKFSVVHNPKAAKAVR